jgi:hypothetical protein
MGDLTGRQRRRIEDNFTRVTDTIAVSEDALQFGPPDARAVFCVNHRALSRHLGIQGSKGCFWFKLDRHGR